MSKKNKGGARRRPAGAPLEGRNERGQFTKDHKIGEATRFAAENAASCKYREEYADEILKFFDRPSVEVRPVPVYDDSGVVTDIRSVAIAADYPTFEAFAFQLGVTSRTLENWCKESPRFSDAYARAKEIQRAKLVAGALAGRYNQNFAKFVAVNCHGMAERMESDNRITYEISLPQEIDEEAD